MGELLAGLSATQAGELIDKAHLNVRVPQRIVAVVRIRVDF